MRLAWVSIVLATLLAFLLPGLGRAAGETTLTVSVTGAGMVYSSDQRISCPPTCKATYQQQETVDLTAQANPDERFTGWSGECSGSGACRVIMDKDRSVGAAFTGGGGSPTPSSTSSPTPSSSSSPTPSSSSSPTPGSSSTPTPGPRPLSAYDRMKALVHRLLRAGRRNGKQLHKRRLVLGRPDDLCPRGCRVRVTLRHMRKRTFAVKAGADPELVIVVPRGIVGNGDIRARLSIRATDTPTGAWASGKKRITLRRG